MNRNWIKSLKYIVLGLILVFISFWGTRHYVLTRVVKEDAYTSFTAQVESTEKKKCRIERGGITDEVDCHEIAFVDPTDGKEYVLEITSENYQAGAGSSLQKGEYLRINKVEDSLSNGTNYVFTGFDRTVAYFWIFLIFIAVVIAVAGKRGARSILSLLVSVVVIWKVIIPLIIAGHNPILVATGIGFVMYVFQIYLTNGLNKQSTISIMGAAVGVAATVIFAWVFSDITNITGFGDESSGFLSLNSAGAIPIRELLIASFILGVLGVVDDASVSQVSVVGELMRNGKALKSGQLFRSAMRVGSSHIGSLMNTLFLAYVASALPLITLLFIYNPDFYQIINIDLFTEEIVRTVVGSMGLVLSIPASTYFAVKLMNRDDFKDGHHHH